MVPKRVNWGIVSTANIGRKAVAPAISESSNGKLAAVASRSASSAQAYAQELGVERAFGAYEDLLASEEVDAVYIPLPNSMHHEWTLKALAAGKHVLCEKPLAMSARECSEMQAAADEAGLFLMEAFMYRTHPRVLKAREIIANGAIGEVRGVRASFRFTVSDPKNIRLQPELGGGALMDVGCYCVDVGRLLLGVEPEEAQARAVWSSSGVDVHLLGLLRFGEAYLQFDCSLDTLRHEQVEVIGTEGRLLLDRAFLPGRDESVLEIFTEKGHELLTFPGVDQYRLMVEEFAEAITLHKAPVFDGAHAAGGMAAIEALYASARAGGQPIAIEKP